MVIDRPTKASPKINNPAKTSVQAPRVLPAPSSPSRPRPRSYSQAAAPTASANRFVSRPAGQAVPHFAICSPKGYQYFIPKVYHSNLIYKVNSTLFLWCPWKRAQIRVSTFTNWLKHYNLREVVIHCQPQIRKQHRTL